MLGFIHIQVNDLLKSVDEKGKKEAFINVLWSVSGSKGSADFFHH